MPIRYDNCKRCGVYRPVFRSNLCQACHAEKKSPTPEEIRTECARIREGWDDRRIICGPGGIPRDQQDPYSPTVYHLSPRETA